MARLRTLLVTEDATDPATTRDILVLDRLTKADKGWLSEFRAMNEGVDVKIIAFPFDVDLPEIDHDELGDAAVWTAGDAS